MKVQVSFLSGRIQKISRQIPVNLRPHLGLKTAAWEVSLCVQLRRWDALRSERSPQGPGLNPILDLPPGTSDSNFRSCVSSGCPVILLESPASGDLGCHLKNRVSDWPRSHTLSPIRDVAHEILNEAYRKVLDQLSSRKYLQSVVTRGVG